MKSTSFCLSLFLLLNLLMPASSFASDVTFEVNKKGDEITLTAQQVDDIADDLDAQSEKEDGAVKKSLKKISNGFKKLAQNLKRDKTKKKKKITLKRALMGAGKGSTFVSVNLMRPFVSMASFFTGLFEKPGKNQDAKAFLQFFLNHESELNDSWRNTGTVDVFAEKLQEKIEIILLEKQVLIIQDLFKHYTKVDVSRESVLKSIGIEPYADDSEIKTLQEIAFDALGPELMFFEIDVDLINEHPEYQELRPLIGDLLGDSLDSIMTFRPEFDLLDLGNRSRLQLHEGLIAFSAKIFVPKIVIGLVAKSIGNIVTVAGLAADLGTVASTLICTINKKAQAALENGDKDYINFCSYVVNKSAYVISRSRARGYVSGKNFRRNLIKKTERIRRRLRGKSGNSEEPKA